MAEFSEAGDELHNPALNAPDNPNEVSARVDEAQGFQVEQPLPGEDVADDGYESALAGRPPGEPGVDADSIDRSDVEAGLAEPYTAGSTQSE